MSGWVIAVMDALNYAGAVSFTPEGDIPDLTGKVIFVTGGNAGLGKETALQLTKHNPKKIFLGARSEAKAEEAIKSLKSSIPNDVEIVWIPLDLMSAKLIKNAAEQVNAQSSRLDILILNAGVMALPPGETEMGHEIQLGTNYTGHFYLTKLLLPTLVKTAEQPGSDVRVVSLASVGHNFAPAFEKILDQEKLKKVNRVARYGASKAANILFAAELGRRYPSLTSVAVHPGIILTNLYDAVNSHSPLAAMGSKVLRFSGSTVHQGACNSLWAAAGAKKEELTSGGYYVPLGILKRRNKWACNEDAGKRLWEWTELELTKANL
ncbi:Short-chain dehydrogenase/reductase SDR [Penicillium cf. griseofulvum]|uniref:Short-chain dehydrogenase/reductase SDR n=1 Tax=Penicillium cf. griseofulvum TaxID=2972120 RepID=A0A9W9MZW8_9EURO|nr:Short-chain dehydrogenase/reductase SDR [Penicillium cf. griseofulvum]KAJ5421811.1 Short-chain dehydrogenase/reductase SDR [Penicillium cf. griseofulvum]KAJ5428002.1 Short-chain dehydrogenase/reductase SDR [Penicillium cf. griseofulvum]